MTTLGTLWRSRDELHLKNIRLKRWSALALLPLSIIIGDLRLLWQDYEFMGMDSVTLMLFGYGLGILLMAFLPQKALRPALKVGAVASAALLLAQWVLPANAGPAAMTALFVAYQAANALCMAGGYYTFFYQLRNVERLAVALAAQLYYTLVNDLLWEYEGFATFMKGPGSAIFVTLFCLVVFLGHKDDFTPVPETSSRPHQGEYSVFFLDITYFTIGLMAIYLDFQDSLVRSPIFAIGSLIAIAVVLIVQLVFNRSIYHMWNLFLVLSMIAVLVLLIPTVLAVNLGSLIYGISDSVGYVVILYILGGAARHVSSYRFFRVAMLLTFGEYCLLQSGIDVAFAHLEVPDNYIVVAVVALFVLVGVMVIPLMAKNLFTSDWSDGYRQLDMSAYSDQIDQVNAITQKADLDLTSREREIFVALLSGKLLKQIASELRISYSTVNFHTNNLYRKLDVRGRSFFLARYHRYIDDTKTDSP